ncbi:MAG: thioredoxin domain-containing protein [Caulobacteraceae bacterium]
MRPFILAFSAILAALALSACQKAAQGATSGDMSMGSPNAKVTMIEYASVACPHCAEWNDTVFPAFKAKYIDTGKVRYVVREALTGDPAVAAAGFLTAHCAGKGKYFQVVDAIYHAQPEMERTGDPHAVLLDIARSAGLTDAQFQACITNEAALNALQSRWNRYVTVDKITGTPTYVINGKVYANGAMSMPQLDAAVAQAETGGKPVS